MIGVEIIMEEEDEGGNGWSNILYNPVWILNIRDVPTLCCTMIAVVVYVKLEEDECGGFVFC